MPASQRWFIQTQAGRPPVVLLGAIALAVTAATAVGVSVWMQRGGLGVSLAAATASFALLAAALLQWRRRGGANAAMGLAADVTGNWSLQDSDGWRAVSLVQVWRGPYWLTLTLLSADGSAKMTTLTVWRSAVSVPDWRKLCILLRTRPSRPARENMANTR